MGLFEKSRLPGYAAVLAGAALTANESRAEEAFDFDAPEVVLLLGLLAAVFGPWAVKQFSKED